MSLPEFELTPAVEWLESEGLAMAYRRAESEANYRRGLFSVKDDYTYPLEINSEAMRVYFDREDEAA